MADSVCGNESRLRYLRQWNRIRSTGKFQFMMLQDSADKKPTFCGVYVVLLIFFVRICGILFVSILVFCFCNNFRRNPHHSSDDSQPFNLGLFFCFLAPFFLSELAVTAIFMVPDSFPRFKILHLRRKLVTGYWALNFRFPFIWHIFRALMASPLLYFYFLRKTMISCQAKGFFIVKRTALSEHICR